MAVKIILKNSSNEDKRPTAAQLENGEIALNYNAAGAFLTCKDTDGNIQQVGGVKISEVAPDSPVKQTLWFQPSSLTLFVYDGTSFLPIAGGGGGGTPGGGITTIIGNNGIDASEIAGVVTLDVELAGGDDGLEFSASKLKASVASASQLGSVKIGDAISVTGDGTITPRVASTSQTGIVKIGDGIDVAGDGTISVEIPQALTFKGSVDLNNPPTGQVELPSAPGDAYVNSATANPVDNGWVGIGGEVAQAGDLVVWDGSQWEIIGTGGTPDVDLGYTAAADQGTVTNSAGDDAVIPVAIASDSNATPATAGVAGLFTGAEKEKLAGIEDGATNEGTNDGRYLRTDAAAGDQTVASTGTTTFSGLTEHGGGVKVTGGAEDISRGIYSPSSNTLGIALSDSDGDESTPIFTQVGTNFSRVRLGKSDSDVNIAQGGVTVTTVPADKNSTTEIAAIVNINSEITDNLATELDGYDLVGVNTTLRIENPFTTPYQEVNLYRANDFYQNRSNVYGYYGNISLGTGSSRFNFFAGGDASNFFAGNTFIGGTTARNTRELWESLLTEEQKEELAAGTLVVPANVATPGDGEFVRQWWYDQQSAEDQALIDAGELEYPKHFQAANFVDTFDLGDNTAINLLSNGRGEFKGGVRLGPGGSSGSVVNGIFSSTGKNVTITSDVSNTTALQSGLTIFLNNIGNRDGLAIASYTSSDLTNFNNFVDKLNKAAGYTTGLIQDQVMKDNSVRIGYESTINTNATAEARGVQSYNFYTDGTAPNYFAGEVTGGGTDGATPQWTIAPNGTATGITVTRAAVVTDEQAGTVETLLDIITDLRARVEALEAAATS